VLARLKNNKILHHITLPPQIVSRLRILHPQVSLPSRKYPHPHRTRSR